MVIPCYNQAHFLSEAIESVLAQDHPHTEIVVVDDGSTDNTAKVAAHYPQVHLIRQQNQGLSAARNVGLESSHGDYILFLDADDRLLPGAVGAGLEALRAHPECAFAFGHYRYVTADGVPLPVPQQSPLDEDPYLKLLRCGNYIGMQATVVYRRDTLVSVGGFDASVEACEDYDLHMRIARRFPICQHNGLVAEYRQHDANMSHNAGWMLKWALKVLRAQREHLQAENDYRVAYKKAYKIGTKIWIAWYSRQLADATQAHMRGRDWKAAIGELLVLLRYHPPREMVRVLLPVRVRRRLRFLLWRLPWVRFGSLRRLTPISFEFGYDRGQPVDRYYIERFLARQARDIQGRVLEIGDNSYTQRFGGSRVTASDILDVTKSAPQATIVADLTRADHVPSNTFDCIILTQTLHLIYEVRSAIQTLYRILKPGGILLATFPGISPISRDEWRDSWYWAFTSRSARRLFEEAFPAEAVRVEAYGNVLAAISFLHGLPAEELRQKELHHNDAYYEVLIALRAVKPRAML